ncbi:uncharacterized protein BCR38DRAFT_478034 [Pseudomassariella vexata]|uniref:Uncharacterized protein n=1 Tax=Pseudomassariella vexata TaxID=1141098 RepID=A0A1Y2DGA1_9PEZI|nr:uncharacterized protein BCR38DRAFT_478034 [Pseudomassariella vexata]ORY58227.1 hypothetical protein BCR38DRAFT_478034 [Pseudomassariella vexata]
MYWYTSKKAAVAAILAGGCGVAFSPYANALPATFHRRAVGQSIADLVIAVKDFLKDANAYDPSVPDKCKLTLRTTSGANCESYINCEENDQIGHSMPGWNVCYLGGRQFFTDPDLGDFSVTFTKAGGVDGNTQDGQVLHHPVVQLAGFNDWEPIDIQAIVDEQGDRDEGKLCTFSHVTGTEQLQWVCGLPKNGARSAFGMSIIDEDVDKDGYTPGWCVAKVNQYQKNEYGNGGTYAFDVIIYDASGDQIGSLSKANVDGNGDLAMYSKLPATLLIHVGDTDDDPVSFAYNGQSWTCDDTDGGDHACTLGNGQEYGYENGDREGYTGFTC